MTYLCPLCQSLLTKDHYHKVLKLQDEQQRIQKGELEILKKQVVAAKQKEKELRLKARQDADAARQQGALNERKRTERLMAGQAERIKMLQEKVKMLKSGETHHRSVWQMNRFSSRASSKSFRTTGSNMQVKEAIYSTLSSSIAAR